MVGIFGVRNLSALNRADRARDPPVLVRGPALTPADNRLAPICGTLWGGAVAR